MKPVSELLNFNYERFELRLERLYSVCITPERITIENIIISSNGVLINILLATYKSLILEMPLGRGLIFPL